MKYILIFISILFIACNPGTVEPKAEEESSGNQKGIEETKQDAPLSNDTVKRSKPKPFFNQRFREVTVTKIDTGKYDVRGQAQMFEADFEWAVNGNGKEI